LRGNRSSDEETGLDIESVRTIIEQAAPASLGVSFAIGFFFSFNPVAFAAIPVSLAYVTKARDRRTAWRYAGMFVLGMLLVQALMGLIAGLGGAFVQQWLGRWWGLVLGPLLIVLGLLWPSWIRLPLPLPRLHAQRVTTHGGALLLGGLFSVAVCPFCTPALVVLLGIAVGSGSPLFGLLLLLAFALGRAVPVLIGAWGMGYLEQMKGLGRFNRAFEVLGGITLILAGLYMLNAYFFVIPWLAA